VICTVPLRTGSEGEGEANFGVVSTFSPPAEVPPEEEVPPEVPPEDPPEEGCEDGDVPVVALEPAPEPDPLELEPQPAMSDSVEQASAVNSRAAVNSRRLFIG
jgi:hypothetical protein